MPNHFKCHKLETVNPLKTARTQKALKETFMTLQEEAEKLGLIVHTTKTKYNKTRF
jgi:hypothetical protein